MTFQTVDIKCRFSTSFVATSLLALFTVSANATPLDPVIYDNGQTPAANNIPNNSWSSGIFTFDNRQRADDFTLDRNYFLTDIHWWGGGLADGDDGNIEGELNRTSFRILVYPDNGGEPAGGTNTNTDPTGSALYVIDGTASVVDTGLDFNSGRNIYEYWVDIDPLYLSGGTDYWLAIQAVSFPHENWFWAAYNDGGNMHAGTLNNVNVPFWTEQPATQGWTPAFYLTGVPEPATVLLMGLGLAGLGFARRRRLNA